MNISSIQAVSALLSCVVVYAGPIALSAIPAVFVASFAGCCLTVFEDGASSSAFLATRVEVDWDQGNTVRIEILSGWVKREEILVVVKVVWAGGGTSYIGIDPGG